MSEERLEMGPFDPSPGGDKKRLTRTLLFVFIIGVFGIGASVGAVYFFKGAAGGDFFDRARASLSGLVTTRELPEDKFSQSSAFSFRNAKSDPQTGESPKRFGKVLINEIQIAGATADDEFIELFNPNDFSVDLTNWRIVRKNASGKEYALVSAAKLKGAAIPGRGYLLLGRDSGYAGAVPADILWAKSNGITENNTIILYGKNGDDIVIVDKVGFGSASDFEGAPAPNPEKGFTISRLSNSDTDNNAADFVLSEPSPRGPVIAAAELSSLIPTKSPGATPSPASSPSASPAASPTPTASPASARQYGKVLISEVQTAGASANDEFVELFNPNDFVVDLTGWSIKRKSASGLEYSLVSSEKLKDKVIPARGYFLLANGGAYVGSVAADVLWAQSNTIALDNTIILYGKRGDETLIVDKVGFGAASDYESSPAQNPAAGQTLSRARETDTNNNRNDFILSAPSPRNSKSGSGFVAPTAAPTPSPSPNSTPSPNPTIIPSPTPTPSSSLLPSPSPSPSPSLTPESSPSPTPELSPNPTTSPSPSPSPSPNPTPTPSPSPSPIPSANVVINEIQVAGAIANDEFIELFNATNQEVNLSSWSIQYRGSEANNFAKKNFTSTSTISAGGYFLIAHSDFNPAITADMRHSSFSLSATGGTVFLVSNTIPLSTGNEPNIVDKVAYGAGTYLFPEGSTFSPAPPASQSIQRGALGQDNDNNAADFELNTSPTPQNSST